MPELPEVETIKRDLEKAVTAKTIAEVVVLNPAVVKEPKVAEFKKRLIGCRIGAIIRKAKVLILELSRGGFLVIHLKMTGQLVYPGTGNKSRLIFRFSDGTQLDFNDQRLFGELRLVDDWRGLSFIQGLGPEPFALSDQQFYGRLSGKKARIKPLLLDQTFISGIGNLYAAESLFRARINPRAAAASLTRQQASDLLRAIKEVLAEAVRCGGSSVDDYVRLSGQAGKYAKHHKVYARQSKPCFVCQTPINRISLGGRGTYFCPRCQQT